MKKNIVTIGFGSIAADLIQQLQAQSTRYAVAVLLRPGSQSRSRVPTDIAVLEDIAQVCEFAPDLVVEAAGHQSVRDTVPALLAAGFPVLLSSIGALGDDEFRSRLEWTAMEHGTRIMLASGALGALDYVRAVRDAREPVITYESRKPVKAWEAELRQLGQEPETLSESITLFEGSARQAAAAYPQNLNVAAALALAGTGFEGIRVKVVCDPELQSNVHLVRVDSELGSFEARIANSPSKSNPKSSQIVAHSLHSAIGQFFAPIVIL
ncbi:aspartate dehydrogenase [Bosea sp. TND4EK4]|jgi:aspartate dehydrogenase|uniref:aspartate dehydrogenase n=1 Tax=Bosea sp. TND4EK4 TaxID=1907408 RepID=UPI0009567F1A|nr:aspartate dehydrogenase [Bosea sp. TND4EK4]SIR46236.1 aspartate dehydrogenase [Bosea sp. TND4EK4]